MRLIVGSIEGEYLRYKQMAEGAIRQLSDAQLAETRTSTDNSVATIVWHIAGNLRSRFTDFLTTDGEKPWRNRETEFLPRQVTQGDLFAFWEQGWSALWGALAEVSDQQLARMITIRNQPLSVMEALHRSLAHASYHVGQIVFIAKGLRGSNWETLSIPPGKSREYNSKPALERLPRAPKT